MNRYYKNTEGKIEHISNRYDIHHYLIELSLAKVLLASKNHPILNELNYEINNASCYLVDIIK